MNCSQRLGMVALPNELLNNATRPLSDRLAQSTQKAQMLQTVFNIGYEKFEDTQCRFFQAQSKSNRCTSKLPIKD